MLVEWIDPAVTAFLLLETIVTFGLTEALQDAVAGAMGDAAEIPLARVKDLLVGAGVGLAAARRIEGRLVRGAPVVQRSFPANVQLSWVPPLKLSHTCPKSLLTSSVTRVCLLRLVCERFPGFGLWCSTPFPIVVCACTTPSFVMHTYDRVCHGRFHGKCSCWRRPSRSAPQSCGG
jgi:hypothetical protein